MNTFEIVEVYGETANETRWAILCQGVQWGPGPRGPDGAASATWPTKESAEAYLKEHQAD